MCAWFSAFFEKALVSRVMRRLPILIERLLRSTNDVLTYLGSVLPSTRYLCAPVQIAGLYPVFASVILHVFQPLRRWLAAINSPNEGLWITDREEEPDVCLR